MAIAVDASTPARFSTLTGAVASIVSASFTAPANSILLLVVSGAGDVTTISPSDSVGNLVWTVDRTKLLTSGAGAWVYAAHTVVPTSAARTVTLTFSPALSTGASAKIYVLTGANSLAPIGAVVGSGTSAANPLNAAAYTSTVAGSLGFSGIVDDTGATGLTSTDTFEVDGTLAIGSSRKAAATAAAGTAVAFNWSATGTPSWAWVGLEVLPQFLAAAQNRDRDRRVTREITNRDRWVTRDRGRGQRSQFDLYKAATAVSAATTPQTLSATETQTPTIATVAAHLRTLTATETQTPTFVKQVGHITPTVTQTQTPTIVKSVGKILSATETQTPTRTSSTIFAKALSATQVQTATMVRSVGKILSATQTQTRTLAKSVGKTLSATETQAPVLTASRAFLKALSATQTQTAAMVRSVGKVLSATETQTSSMRRSTAKILTVTQVQTRTIAKSITKTLSAVAAQVTSLVATFHGGVPDAPLTPPLSTTFADNGVRSTTGDAGVRSTTATTDGRRTTQLASNGLTYTQNLNP